MDVNKMMDPWPPQQLAVVIGVGGMGMAVARRLGQQYRLLLTDIDEQRLIKAADQLDADGIRADAVVCDVTSATSVQSLADRVETIGELRALVHVAGLSPSMGNWRTIMSVDLVGPALVTNALLPHARQGTSAVLIASLAAHLLEPSEAVTKILSDPLADDFLDKLEAAMNGDITPELSYAYAKNALIKMSERHAVSWGEKHARINSLSPGLIATPMGLKEYEGRPEKVELLKKTPLQRQGGMLEIADVVEFLISNRSSFMTGTNLLVDGGVAAALKHPNSSS